MQRIKCPFCKRSIKYKIRYAGREKPCPGCGKIIRLPDPGYWARFLAWGDSNRFALVSGLCSIVGLPFAFILWIYPIGSDPHKQKGAPEAPRAAFEWLTLQVNPEDSISYTLISAETMPFEGTLDTVFGNDELRLYGKLDEPCYWIAFLVDPNGECFLLNASDGAEHDFRSYRDPRSEEKIRNDFFMLSNPPEGGHLVLIVSSPEPFDADRLLREFTRLPRPPVRTKRSLRGPPTTKPAPPDELDQYCSDIRSRLGPPLTLLTTVHIETDLSEAAESAAGDSN